MQRLPDLREIDQRVRHVEGLRCSLCEGCTGKRGEVAIGMVYGPSDLTVQRCAVFVDQSIIVHPTSINYLFTDDHVYSVEYESISECGHWLAFKIKWGAALDAIDLEIDDS